MSRSILLFYWAVFLFLINVTNLCAQSLSLEEYMGYVKQFHPFVKQADIVLNESEAKLLKARGDFDNVAVKFKEKR